MKRLVVDASVTLKWLIPEAGDAEALRLLQQYLEGETVLMAPHLLFSEVANALWKRIGRGQITAAQAGRAFSELLMQSPVLVHSESASRAALDLSIAHGHPAYDCLYLALALEHRCDLVTADRRLYQAMGGTYSCIRLL